MIKTISIRTFVTILAFGFGAESAAMAGEAVLQRIAQPSQRDSNRSNVPPESNRSNVPPQAQTDESGCQRYDRNGVSYRTCNGKTYQWTGDAKGWTQVREPQ